MLEKKVEGALAEYEAGSLSMHPSPHPQDVKTQHRNGYEAALRLGQLKGLRETVDMFFDGSPHPGQIWKIVGGRRDDGVLVRTGVSLQSPLENIRLATGSWIEEVELVGERLSYNLVRGYGPSVGWVSIRVKNTMIAERLDNVPQSLIKKGKQKHKKSQPHREQQPEQAADKFVNHQRKPPTKRLAILALMAAHISSKDRLTRLQATLRTIEQQDLSPEAADLVVAISWYSPDPELSDEMGSILSDFSAQSSNCISRIVVQQKHRHSQFEHVQQAMNAAVEELQRCWSFKV